MKSFSILPLCSFAAKHVTIDTGILWGLLVRVAARAGLERPVPLEVFKSNPRDNWASYFKLSRAEGNNTRRTFEFLMKTDGYAASMVMGKEKEEKKPGKKSLLLSAVDLSNKRVIGVDPGRADLVNCAWTDQEGNTVLSRFSNAEYQEKIGLKKASAKRKEWMVKANLHGSLTQLASAKVPTSALMRTHIVEMFGILERVLELNGKRRVRDLRFGQFCRRQRVMYDICKRITVSDVNDLRKHVVAFGAAAFSSSSKGHCPGPVKEIRKALRRRGVEVYDVNEDYTSQLCNCCKQKLVPMYSEGGNMAIHGVRRCLTATCMRKTLNRDVNAAVNMLFVFNYENLRGSRPKVFTRKYQTRLRNNVNSRVLD